MQTTLKLTIPLRNEKDEIVPNARLMIIEADKHGQATVTINKQRVFISLDDLREAATDLWLFLNR